MNILTLRIENDNRTYYEREKKREREKREGEKKREEENKRCSQVL